MVEEGVKSCRRCAIGKKCFQKTGMGSFWGEYLYERVVPQDHFLRHLERVIDWEVFGAQLLALYAGQGEFERPPYPPETVLKMLLVTYLFNLSERQVEVYVQENLPARWFVGLAADEQAPDHTTLSAFKGRIVTRGQEACLQALLAEIIRQAQARGVRLDTIQVVDRKPVVANGNVAREEPRGGGADAA